jgi:hypothetical protein
MKLSQRLQDEKTFLVKKLGTDPICHRCGASLETFADDCLAACPGFLAIDSAKTESR